MTESRRLAAKIDQHMQQLATQGVNDALAIINRMLGYVPNLHKIWVVVAVPNSWRYPTNFRVFSQRLQRDRLAPLHGSRYTYGISAVVRTWAKKAKNSSNALEEGDGRLSSIEVNRLNS
jgi:hypothetical protein